MYRVIYLFIFVLEECTRLLVYRFD